MTTEARFWAKVTKTDTCWLWTGARIGDGYGNLRIGQRTYLAHRIVWEWKNGPIPCGMQLDHLCRVRHCVNPEHLRLVTNKENVLAEGSQAVSATNALKNACPHGHAYDTIWKETANKGVSRRCRTCERERGRRRYAANPEYWREWGKRRKEAQRG